MYSLPVRKWVPSTNQEVEPLADAASLSAVPSALVCSFLFQKAAHDLPESRVDPLYTMRFLAFSRKSVTNVLFEASTQMELGELQNFANR